MRELDLIARLLPHLAVRGGVRVSLWWQVWAFVVITLAEVLISVTGLELAFTAAPKSMKGFVTGCWLLTVGVANLQGEFMTDWGIIFSGAALAALPMIVFFLLFQKYFLEGVRMGAVKG